MTREWEPIDPDKLEADLDRAMLEEDDGAAAKAILAAGRPIHIRRPDTPSSWVIRIYPDGSEELVYVDIAHIPRRKGGT